MSEFGANLRLPLSQFVVRSVAVYLLLASLTGCNSQSAAPASTKSAANSTAVPSDTKAAKHIDRQHPVVHIVTNLGTMIVRLDAEKSPGTVRNFLNYVNEGFYKDTIFHYVDPGKMVMGGGYTADHKLKPAKSPIRNEAHNGRKNVRGTLAMARNPAFIDSANSQFFINLTDARVRDHAARIPPTHTDTASLAK